MKSFNLAIWMALVTAITPAPGIADEAATPLLSSTKATIAKQDFDASMQRIPESDRIEFALDQKRIDGMLQNLYVNRVLAGSARELKMDQDPLVARQMALQAEQLLAKLRIEKLRQDTKLPDFGPRAQELYKADGDRFKVPGQVHAAHILINTKTRTRDEALKKATEIRSMVVAQAKDFGKLAEELSDDPSAKSNKGDLGFFAPDRMVKPFSEAAFALKTPGQVSEPVETSFGFHIIKLIEKKDGHKKPFESVKADLIKGLQHEFLDGAVSDYLNAIRGDKEIKVNADAIAKLKPVMATTVPTAKTDAKRQ